MDKTILLATFLYPEKVEEFINHMGNKFGIQRDKIFGYKNLDDESRTIITFRVTLLDNKHINLNNLSPNAIIIHKKGEAMYTINALNKLIETIIDDNSGNIDHKSVKVNWANYQNKFILLDNKELVFLNIKRIF